MSTFRQGTLAALLVGGMLAFAGCGAKVSDDAIAKDVQGKVSSDPTTKDSPVNVTVKDGKVTLRGTVKDAATQQRTLLRPSLLPQERRLRLLWIRS